MGRRRRNRRWKRDMMLRFCEYWNVGELFAYTFYFFFAGEVPMLYFLPVGKVKWRIEMVHFT